MKKPKYYVRSKDDMGYTFSPVSINKIKKLAKLESYDVCRYILIEEYKNGGDDTKNIKEALKRITEFKERLLNSVTKFT